MSWFMSPRPPLRMSLVGCCLLAMRLLGVAPAHGQSAADSLDVEDNSIENHARRALVHIEIWDSETESKDHQYGKSGTGFVVRRTELDIYILTAYHVLFDSRGNLRFRIRISAASGIETDVCPGCPARNPADLPKLTTERSIVATAEMRDEDLLLLKIPHNGFKTDVLELGDASDLTAEGVGSIVLGYAGAGSVGQRPPPVSRNCNVSSPVPRLGTTRLLTEATEPGLSGGPIVLRDSIQPLVLGLVEGKSRGQQNEFWGASFISTATKKTLARFEISVRKRSQFLGEDFPTDRIAPVEIWPHTADILARLGPPLPTGTQQLVLLHGGPAAGLRWMAASLSRQLVASFNRIIYLRVGDEDDVYLLHDLANHMLLGRPAASTDIAELTRSLQASLNDTSSLLILDRLRRSPSLAPGDSPGRAPQGAVCQGHLSRHMMSVLLKTSVIATSNCVFSGPQITYSVDVKIPWEEARRIMQSIWEQKVPTPDTLEEAYAKQIYDRTGGQMELIRWLIDYMIEHGHSPQTLVTMLRENQILPASDFFRSHWASLSLAKRRALVALSIGGEAALLATDAKFVIGAQPKGQKDILGDLYQQHLVEYLDGNHSRLQLPTWLYDFVKAELQQDAQLKSYVKECRPRWSALSLSPGSEPVLASPSQ